MGGLFNKVKWGDGLSVTDEGSGVIRVDSGGAAVAEPPWCLIGTGNQTNLATGVSACSIAVINTNAPAVFEAVYPSVSVNFIDTATGAGSNNWNLNAFQVRNAALDASHAAAWAAVSSTTITDALTVTTTGELVYEFLVKEYIRGLTAVSPYTLLYTQGWPLSAGQTFATSATGQGSGVVNWSGTVPAGDVSGTQKYESLMVGLKANGGTPTQISLTFTAVSGNATAVPALPATQANDLLLLQVALRNGTSNPTIATPLGWTLVTRAPDRNTDANWLTLDQLIYVHTGAANAYVLQIDETGVYEIHAAFQAVDATATGTITGTLAASAGGTFSTWVGGNNLDVSRGTAGQWLIDGTRILAVDTAPVQVSLTVNNASTAALDTWEAGIFARRLGDPVTTSTWDI